MTGQIVGCFVCVLLLIACDTDTTAQNTRLNTLDTSSIDMTEMILDAVRYRDAQVSSNKGPSASVSLTAPVDEYDASEYRWINAPLATEMWHYFAVLNDPSGNWYAWQQRFSRLKLRQAVSGAGTAANEAGQEIATSEWSFTDVMQAQLILESEAHNKALLDERRIQRVALGLAGIDAEQQRLWVDRLEVQRQDVEQNGSACDFIHRLAAPGAELELRQTVCSESREFGVFNAAVASFNAEAQLTIADAAKTSVSGTGWLNHVFGAVPIAEQAKGAVLIDRVWLALNDGSRLMLNRSRRRNGTGPITVAGHWEKMQPGMDNGVRKLVKSTVPVSDALQFTDQWDENITLGIDSKDNRNADAALPSTWLLKNTDDGKALSLTPMVGNINRGEANNRWLIAVSVSGDQSGAGFIDYQMQ